MQPRVIKTEEDYELALARMDELMGAMPDTAEGDEFELLVTLVELYDERMFPIDLPDATTAIKFRMEQKGLMQKDLVKYIGSKSKVSEVLAGKRPLSLRMIRELQAGLRIPAEVLLQKPEATLPPLPENLEWEKFPLNEMISRRWLFFEGTRQNAKEYSEELLSEWVAPLGPDLLQPALLRQHVRGRNISGAYPLTAWRIRVLLLALEQSIPTYNVGSITSEFARDLVKLSYLDNGPLLAKELLMKMGVHVVIEPHLKKTHLDGAAMFLPNGSPVIALTLRHDRLDNFWFTLCHELAHLSLHLGRDDWDLFYDDLDSKEGNELEAEADHWASDALIKEREWQKFCEMGDYSTDSIRDFAEKQRVHTAIPAGRLRRELDNYKILSKLVGHGEVRKIFIQCA
jgi:HTH-type transcriptional regulator / antitoxin HigA